jgi:hypothetical protein
MKSDCHDPQFCRIFLRVLGYKLTSREMKYLIMRFYHNYDDKGIAKWESRRITKQAINLVIQKAYIKIKIDRKK